MSGVGHAGDPRADDDDVAEIPGQLDTRRTLWCRLTHDERTYAASGDDGTPAPRARPDRDEVKRRFNAIRPRQFNTVSRMGRAAFAELCGALEALRSQ
ncbi:hypothetical protein KFE25_005577 [Diacronema lutheri]|uniref:Uncharacterized protein n=2 Tax=Diacronema lutheri TaxID=2081491 RepID=A0A8J5XPS9_DIALT|nr:hypothetical protein KFE25_005577 [Diacronema lutheri]